MGPDGVQDAVSGRVALAQQLTMLRDAVAALTNVPPESLEVGEATAAQWGRDNGTTSVSTGILLCWYHHKVVHQRSLAIRRSTDGAWEFRRVDGRQLGPPVGSWAGESQPGGSPPGTGAVGAAPGGLPRGTGAVGAAPGGEPDDPRPPRGSPVDQDVHVTPEVLVTPNPRVTAHLQDELPLAG